MRHAIVSEIVAAVTVVTPAGSTMEQVGKRKEELIAELQKAGTRIVSVRIVELEDHEVPGARPG